VQVRILPVAHAVSLKVHLSHMWFPMILGWSLIHYNSDFQECTKLWWL